MQWVKRESSVLKCEVHCHIPLRAYQRACGLCPLIPDFLVWECPQRLWFWRCNFASFSPCVIDLCTSLIYHNILYCCIFFCSVSFACCFNQKTPWPRLRVFVLPAAERKPNALRSALPWKFGGLRQLLNMRMPHVTHAQELKSRTTCNL